MNEQSEGIVSNDLHLQHLSLQMFRSYNSLALSDLSPLNIFIGPNAVGKTSIIEAIQLITALKSFRTSKTQQMILWGSNAGKIEASFISSTRNLQEELHLTPKGRKYSLNGKPKRIQDLKGLVPAVTFCPDDLLLVKGSNTGRLQAVDDVGTQLSKNFYAVKKDYVKVIKQKNKALKEEQPYLVLDSIDEVLIKIAAQYLSHRLYVVNNLRQKIKDYYQQISSSNEEVDIAYIFSWEKDREEEILQSYNPNNQPTTKEEFTSLLENALKEYRYREQARQKALYGPHADHLLFLLNGKNAIHYASQGQQRSIVLAFKLAESALLQEMLQQHPILLLDDVMSELDLNRRTSFLDFITNDIQTFITTTNSSYFTDSILEQARMYTLPFEEQ